MHKLRFYLIHHLVMQKPRYLKGRAAISNEVSRFVEHRCENFDVGWDIEEDEAKLGKQLFTDNSRKIITYNQSPDIFFDHSINPHRGCEHGFVYCFARPSHAGDTRPGPGWRD